MADDDTIFMHNDNESVFINSRGKRVHHQNRTNRMDRYSEAILEMVRKYRCLPAGMIPYMINLADSSNNEKKRLVKRSVNWLIDTGAIVSEGRCLKVIASCERDDKLITSLWVFLAQFPNVSPSQHARGDSPSQIFADIDGTLVDVCCFSTGEESMARTLKPIDGNHRFIYVVNSDSQIAALKRFVPDTSALFAMPKFGDGGIDYPPTEIVKKVMRPTNPAPKSAGKADRPGRIVINVGE